MKTFFKPMLFTVFFILVIAAGCGQGTGLGTNQGETPGTSNELDESNVSPKDDKEQAEEVMKKTVNLYFSDNNLMNIYRVEREIEVTEEGQLPQLALEAWMQGPEHKELHNLVPPGVVIEYVKDVDGAAHVSFSEEIKNANLGSSGEVALLEQITMILQQFGFQETQVLVEGKIVESLLGHMYTKEPMSANSPDEYEFME